MSTFQLGQADIKHADTFFNSYNCNQNKTDSSLLMKQNANFQAGITQVQSAAIPLQSYGFKTISESFQMRYCTILYLKERQIVQGLKVWASKFTK